MLEHQIILRKILVVGGGIIFLLALMSLSKWIETEPGYLFYGAILLMLVLGSTSARWVMRAIETITGFKFFLSGFMLFMLFVFSMALSFIVLPLGLALLVIQYVLARRRYARMQVAG